MRGRGEERQRVMEGNMKSDAVTRIQRVTAFVIENVPGRKYHLPTSSMSALKLILLRPSQAT